MVTYLGEGAAQLDVRRGGELPLLAHGERAGVQAIQVGHDQQQVRGGLDRQEAAARDVDAQGVFEALYGCSHGRFQLDDVQPSVQSLQVVSIRVALRRAQTCATRITGALAARS